MAGSSEEIMKAWRNLAIVSFVLIIIGACILLWEQRAYRTTPAAAAKVTDTNTTTELAAGGAPAVSFPEPEIQHEDFSGSDISEGKRLYHWFNCVACHAEGGGGIGPALMDSKWIYGSEPRQIYATILEGRPNGMPSFRGKIPDAQVWQLVAYVRSMSGQVPSASRSSRNDDISAKLSESMKKREKPQQGGTPTVDPGSPSK